MGKPVTENYIGALWHNRLLIFPLVLRRFFSNRPGAALISASRDGDLLTDAIHRFGYDVIRGSSSRLGASAILQLTEQLASGRDVVITPDGPRGPVYELGNIFRVKSVHVFSRVQRADDCRFVDMFRGRRLNKNAVNGRIAIQFFDARQQFTLCG